MSALLVTEADAGSVEWHEARANGIGASEIAAVVGLSPFQSAYSLWLEKKGLIPGADPENPLFYWGHALEPVIADRYAELHPEFWVMPMGTHIHSERAWQIANLDRALFPTSGVTANTSPLGVLEIKTSRFGDGYGPSGSDQIPMHVRCQVQQQMDVMEVPFADVAALIGGSDFRTYRIDADAEDQAALREAGARFWESLATNDEPPIDCSFATYEAIRARHPEIDGDDIDLDPALYGKYALTKADADSATDAHRQVKSALLSAMGSARRALVDGVPVLRRQPTRNGGTALYPIKES